MIASILRGAGGRAETRLVPEPGAGRGDWAEFLGFFGALEFRI